MPELQFSRIQSPSSILTFKQCPRKYYFRYILGLESTPNIAQTRGKVVHSVLEDFFSANVSELTRENCETVLSLIVQDLLVKKWKADPDIKRLCPDQNQRFALFEETLVMTQQWVHAFVVPKLLSMPGLLAENFHHIIPEREQAYASEILGVRGFIDAIENHNGETRIMDYKTSASTDMHEHKLQLGIYAILYNERHNKLPHKAGIYFLKSNSTAFIDVNEELVEYAKLEIAFVHENTTSQRIEDYPLKPGFYCKWSTGNCDFYEHCFKGKKTPEASLFGKNGSA